jgi:Xaa-Pro aminopeptidase
MDYSARQKKLRQHLATTRFDALLISHLPNIRYLCGFTGSAGFLLVDESASIFITDVRYDPQARQEVRAAKVVIARQPILRELTDRIAHGRKKSRPMAIGVEGEHMTLTENKRISDLLPSRIRLRPAAAMVDRARMIKDAGELHSIRAAVDLGARLFDRAIEVLRPGVTETTVAAEMEFTARQAGAEAMSFETIIASGKRSALPHGRASSQPVPSGSFVVCDFGVILGGYCSDQTRTVWIRAASEAVPKAARYGYESVLEAQMASIAAVKPGASVSEVDAAGRKVLKKAGLGRYFTHSTGHGVGLEIHEGPRIAAGQKETLRPGMVITIEPGLYFPGKWGVRIEDMVAVTETGCEVLTPTKKDFLAL